MALDENDWGNFKESSTQTLQCGAVMVANPFMEDENFKRSVVLLVELNDSGAMGFILNKPLEISLADVSLEFIRFPAILHYGGPVQLDSLHFLHRIGNSLDGAIELVDGIFWGGDIEQLRKMIMDDEVSLEDVRFFIGYSGWNIDQIKDEYEKNSWIVMDINHELIFNTAPELLWRKILSESSERHSFIANLPENPNYN